MILYMHFLVVHLIGLAFWIPCAVSWCSEIEHDTELKIGNAISEEHDIDASIVNGRYVVDERGEVFMYISWPEKQRLMLGFSNQDSAVRQFGIETAITEIDLKKFCGLEGTATIRISHMQTGEGPARI